MDKPKHYTPDATAFYEEAIGIVAGKFRPEKVYRGAVVLTCRFFLKPPSSWSKKKQAAALRLEVLPTARPDLSNYVKSVEDALNKIIYKDDGQVVLYGAGSGKFYGDPERTVIMIETVVEHLDRMKTDMKCLIGGGMDG